MKRFEFRLERVLELHRQQAEVERARLTALLSQASILEQKRQVLLDDFTQAAQTMRENPSSLGQDWQALSHFNQFTETQRTALARKRAELDAPIAAQRARVAESERRIKLLEKLRSRRLAEWTRLRDAELETLAAESYLARLLARRRIGGR